MSFPQVGDVRTASLDGGLTLTGLMWERMPEEETQHFPRCIRSLRIGVGARRAASRPCVAGAVDIPLL